ncbi:MAG: SPFH domain-containing protein [Candidatus Tagabacteria bacterium]
MKKDRFLLVIGIVYIVFFLAEAVEIFFRRYEFNVIGFNWNWGWAVFFFQVLYTGFCLRTVGPTEWGALLFFGKPIKQLGPGLVFVPWPFCILVKETKLTIQLELPGEPEEVERADQDKPGQGKKIPIRITHASLESAIDPETKKPFTDTQKKAMADDPLNQRLTSEVSFIVRYKIKDFIKFLSTIGSAKEASRQISDTVVLTGQTELAKLTPAQTLTRLKIVSRTIRNSVDYLVGEIPDPDTQKQKDPWGIDVEDASIKLIDTGRRVNVSIADATAAGFEKTAVIQKADGERERLIREGAGVATARRLLLEAEAKGTEALAKASESDAGKLVVQLQTIKTALEKSQYSILAGSDLASAIAAIHETWDKVVSKKSK